MKQQFRVTVETNGSAVSAQTIAAIICGYFSRSSDPRVEVEQAWPIGPRYELFRAEYTTEVRSTLVKQSKEESHVEP